MALTSEELNFLVYRYLQESGFSHSAFVFGYESLVHRGKEPGGGVPPGALVSFVQKGLQYLELEANVANEGSSGDAVANGGSGGGGGGGGPVVRGDFAALTASDLITKDVEELKRAVAERRERSGGGGGGPATAAAAAGGGGGGGGGVDGPLLPASAVTRLEGHSSEVFTVAWSPDGKSLATGSGDGTARLWDVGGGGGSGAGGGGSGGDVSATLSASSILRHTANAAAAPPSTSGATATATAAAENNGKTRDVTTLDWSPDGTLLATGSYDGVARLWSAADGTLVRSLAAHSGPIFSLKWAKVSPSGDGSGGAPPPRLLLSGSVDKRAIVWNADTGEIKQEFECHTAPTLDVDWRDATTFASSSTDGTVRVCRLRREGGEGEEGEGGDEDDKKKKKSEPNDVTTLSGHGDEVNAIKWSPSGRLLASASDDGTARLWDADAGTCVRTLTGHAKEVYSVRWAPLKGGGSGGSGGGGGSDGGGGGGDAMATDEGEKPAESSSSLLATASFDHTVKLWDAETGACVRTLAKHGAPVYSAAFSPDGALLATGSFDRRVHVWSVAGGELVRTYRGKGGVFEVAWAPDASSSSNSGRLAACFSDRSVVVLDMRK